MSALITGGTGFIGARLGLKCLEAGESVTVLGLVNNDAQRRNKQILEKAGARVIVGTVADVDTIAKAMEGARVVYHLAAAQHEANVPDQHFWDVNVQGTERMLQASMRMGVDRFVHGSTIGVYGSGAETELSETSPPKPENIYGKTKLEGEQLVLSRKGDLPVSVVRISETYGPGDHRLLKLFRALDKKLFPIIGKGANKHQPIFVDDLVAGLRCTAVSKRAVGELFVLAGGEVLTTREMVDCIADTLSVPLRALQVPLGPLMLLAVSLEKTLGPLGIQPPLHRRRMDFFVKSFFFSNQKAKSLLQFEPAVNFHDGAKATAAWYKDHGYL